jgi:hypothetical protein
LKQCSVFRIIDTAKQNLPTQSWLSDFNDFNGLNGFNDSNGFYDFNDFNDFNDSFFYLQSLFSCSNSFY